MSEHRPFRPQMAGVTAEASAGDEAEALHPKRSGHFRHQAVQLELGGLGIFFALRPQEQLSAQPGKMICGHVVVAGVIAHAMA